MANSRCFGRKWPSLPDIAIPPRNAGEGEASAGVGGEAAAQGKAVRAALALALQRLGDLKSELDRLAGVEARVAMRQVVGSEALFADLLGTADALGDILARQFEMHAAGIAAFGEMDREGAA